MTNDEDEVKASGRRVISATDHNVTYEADPNAQLVPQDSPDTETRPQRDENNAKVPGRLSIRKKPSSSEFSRQVLANRVYSSQRQHQADRVDARTAAAATTAIPEPTGTIMLSLSQKALLLTQNRNAYLAIDSLHSTSEDDTSLIEQGDKQKSSRNNCGQRFESETTQPHCKHSQTSSSTQSETQFV